MNISNTSTVSVKGAVQGHTLTINEIPSHTHTFTGTQVTTSENGAHTHKNQYDNQKSYGGGNNFGGLNINSNAWGNETNSAGSHTHTVTAKGTNSNTGGGASHTHGIKMTVRGNADTADKTSADNGAATATIKVEPEYYSLRAFIRIA